MADERAHGSSSEAEVQPLVCRVQQEQQADEEEAAPPSRAAVQQPYVSSFELAASTTASPPHRQAAVGGGDGGSSAAAAACLCGAHALARWGWRSWEFSVALILIKLFPSSLLLVSLYGLLDNLTRLLLGSGIGQYIDRADRLQGAVLCYAVQNLCIGASAAAAAVLVWLESRTSSGLRAHNPAMYWLLVGTCMVSGASSSVGSLGAAVAVERDHTKVLCGQDSAALRKLNAAMRAIDLLSQMLAPVAAGVVMSYGSMLAAIAVLAVYSLAAWVPECMLLQAAHSRCPALRQPKPRAPAAARSGGSKRPHPLQLLLGGGSGWATYFAQGTLLPALALALLYLTVLSLGFLMTSFLAWQGMFEATISLFRAAGAVSGLAATGVFHPLQRCGVSLVGAGGLGISWQLACLLMGVMPVVLAHVFGWPHSTLEQPAGALRANGTAPAAAAAPAASPPSGASHAMLYVLLSGLVASRFGLWLFDLAVSQLQQELVPENELGTVSGVQASMQSAFEILSFIAGCIFHRPQQFHWLMAASCASVASAAGLFLAYSRR